MRMRQRRRSAPATASRGGSSTIGVAAHAVMNGPHQRRYDMREIHQNGPASHRFAIGNMVRLSRSIRLRNAVPGLYEILAQLPEREGELQYRIKSEREPFQRIIKEDELEPA